MAGTRRSCRKRASSRKPKKCRKSKPRSARKSCRKSARKQKKLVCDGKTYATKKVRGYTAKCVNKKPVLRNNRRCYVAGACDGRRKLKGADFFNVYPALLNVPGITPNRAIFEDAAKFSCSAKDGGIQRCSNRPHMLSMLWQEFKPYAKLKTMVDMVAKFQTGAEAVPCLNAGDYKANDVNCARELMTKLQQPDFGTGAQLKEFRKMVKDYMDKRDIEYHKTDPQGNAPDMCPVDASMPISDAWETDKPADIRTKLSGMGIPT